MNTTSLCCRAAGCWILLASSFVTAATEEGFGVLLRLGLKDQEAANWSGSIAVQGGEVTQLQGWRFRGGDKIVDRSTWQAKSKDPGGPKTHKGRRVSPVGVLVCGRGGTATRLTVATAQGKLVLALSDLRPGRVVKGLNGAASAERTPMPTVLSDSEREDDYPSVCVAQDGTAWCVWQSYENQGEQLYAARRRGGEWTKPQAIPGAKGDIYKSACAWAGGRLWVVWSQFENGDWDLRLASTDGARWTEPQYLTREKGADIEPAIAARGDRACIAWQAFRGSHSDIQLAQLRDGKWDRPRLVTSAEGNDWAPAVAIGPDGTVSIAWDTYRNGNYDVYLRQLVNGELGPEIPIAAGNLFEAYATVAADPAGRVWVAYEEGTANWGKDQGAVVPNPKPGSRLYAKRATRVRVLHKGQLHAPAQQPVSIMRNGQARRYHEKPRLAVDGVGRVYLCMRWAMFTTQYLRSRGHYRRYKAWESYVTTYEGDRWAVPTYLPDSVSRLDSYAVAGGLPEGGLVAAWHTDRRSAKDIRKPIKNRVVAASLAVPGSPPAPELTPMERPKPSRPNAKEQTDTQRIRAYRADIGGQEHRILRGDLHRHTEVSWDGSGDGSMVDVYRYAIDAGALDFFEVTDHNQRTGPDLEYVWWRTQKLTDVYHNPPHFITLFGYERSLSFPNGHRNVINAKRGFRTFPMTRRADGGRGVAENDTKQLYRYARETDSVIISHTSGTRMGTDWRDNDPALEPVVEIYQGARTSYEYEGAPKSATPGDRHARGSGYQPQGFLWRAWEKGLRLGIIASSDHGSTHISYASVYATAPTREAIIAGLKRRHTFGATDNIILDLRTSTHFMGDELSQTEPPALLIKAIGTAELSELAIVKDLKFVYVNDPEGSEVQFKWQDRDFGPGTHLYYVRVQQTDGQIAWSSPVWVTKK